jgi:hypothetical protein
VAFLMKDKVVDELFEGGNARSAHLALVQNLHTHWVYFPSRSFTTSAGSSFMLMPSCTSGRCSSLLPGEDGDHRRPRWALPLKAVTYRYAGRAVPGRQSERTQRPRAGRWAVGPAWTVGHYRE